METTEQYILMEIDGLEGLTNTPRHTAIVALPSDIDMDTLRQRIKNNEVKVSRFSVAKINKMP